MIEVLESLDPEVPEPFESERWTWHDGKEAIRDTGVRHYWYDNTWRGGDLTVCLALDQNKRSKRLFRLAYWADGAPMWKTKWTASLRRLHAYYVALVLTGRAEENPEQ